MPISITINGSVTLDETPGLQIGGVATATEDNNDSDVSLATLQSNASAFFNRLVAIGVDPSIALGYARSASNYIALSGSGTITSLGFTDSSGSALPVYAGVGGGGAVTNLSAVDGGAITLYRDANLDSRIAYGVDSSGDIVFALYLDPAAGLTQASVWVVEFEALANPVTTNHDDPLAMTGLGVGAGVSSEFNFAGLPSGQNLFGIVGSESSGLVVFGKNTVLNADNTFTNASNTINTSQGGGGTTIGVNNQMFDANEGAYFTYVRGANPNFTGFNLDANEADDADNMQYSDGNGATNDTIEVDSAFLKIAQLQGGGPASMSIAAFNISGSPQGRGLIDASGQGAVAITQVKVYSSAGVLLDDSSNAASANPAISFVNNNGVWTVSGLLAGYKVEWFTNGLHDQVLVSGVGGKFDVGGFGINEPNTVSTPITGIRFEDDGPSVDINLNTTAALRLDETDNDSDDGDVGGVLARNSLLASAYLSLNSASFGSDGQAGSSPTVWSLAVSGANVNGVDSGLDDAATNESILLFAVNATTVEGRSGSAAGPVAFTITIDAASGELTVVQNRAVEHDNPLDHDEDGLSSAMMNSGLVAAVRTVADGDGDSASDNVDVSQLIKFEDDGPSVDIELNGSAQVTVDETTLPASASILASALFSVNSAAFGSDGEGSLASVYRLLLSDDNSGLFDTATGDEVLLSINADGTLITGAVGGGANVVFTIALNASTGEVTLTQSRAMVHDDADHDEANSPLTLPSELVSIQRTITDGDEDSDDDKVDIGQIFKFEDDGPSLAGATTNTLELATDDSDILDVATLSTDLIFDQAPDYGNDGPHEDEPIIFQLRLVGADPASGLVDTATGKAILLKSVAADVVGFVDANGNGSLDVGETTEAIRYSLAPVAGDLDTKTVTFSQSRSVMHDNATDPNEATAPAEVHGGLVWLDQFAVDGDGDISEKASFDLGDITVLLDDGPAIGPVANSIVDFSDTSSVTKSLNGDVGNDPRTSPYILTSYTAGLTVNDVVLQAVLAADSQSVTYYADTNKDSVFGNADDLAYYRLTLNQSGAGEYEFEVLVNPPPANLKFEFDGLPSGQNLFGIVGDAAIGLVVIGKSPVLNADGTFTNASNTINTSKGGGETTIGVNNQMFDPGEGAYFTLVQNPVMNFVGVNLDANEADDADNMRYAGGTLEVSTAFVEIAQLQGGSLATMKIECFNIAGSPQEEALIAASGQNKASITAVRVFNELGQKIEDSAIGGNQDPNVAISIVNGVATVSGLNSKYTVEWDTSSPHDQVLISGVSGKFDIGGFGTTQSAPTPDQLLHFVAQVTDGDGDKATASFSVGIDGTGIFDDGAVEGLTLSGLTSSFGASDGGFSTMVLNPYEVRSSEALWLA